MGRNATLAMMAAMSLGAMLAADPHSGEMVDRLTDAPKPKRAEKPSIETDIVRETRQQRRARERAERKARAR